MDEGKWVKDPNFVKLCDIVASGKLICLTGAGVSKGLKLKTDCKAPDWKELLEGIREDFKNNLSDEEKNDLEELMNGDISGEHLIEASSILCGKDKDKFFEKLKESVALDSGECSETHKRLLDLLPRGILTYNYDVAHENAMEKAGYKDQWEVILPTQNEKIITALRDDLNTPFLFKMHGCVEVDGSMVLTRESYRDLLVKSPYYKFFIQHILTNYRLLIIGFGLSDPDFEMLLQDVFSIFGSPVQEHIVIRHINDKTSKDIIYRLRYGMHFLYVEDFKDIPEILKNCMEIPGKTITGILEKCISNDLEELSQSHREVRELSLIGKRCLANKLESLIKGNIAQELSHDYSSNTINSEYVYTYGVIASSVREKKYKDFLIKEVVEKSMYSETVAHGLYHLRNVLDKDDIGTVKQWIDIFTDKDFKEDSENQDPDNRVLKYCEAIYSSLKAKFRLCEYFRYGL